MSDWPFGGMEPGAYGCIAADPPWHFKARTAIKTANPGSRRDVERHYDTMSLADIVALPVAGLAAKDCHLFLWITGPMLVNGDHLPIMKAWGFKPSSIAFTWVKFKKSHTDTQLRFLPTADAELHVGLGLTTRKNAEFVALGRRGNARRVAKDVREIILSPVREHSRKPDQFYSRVERYVGPGVRKAELFARESRPGWDTFGNQRTLFDESPLFEAAE